MLIVTTSTSNMKALRPLNFLTRHLQSSHSYPSLPLPFLFHRAHLTRLSITRSNRILPSSQTRYSSTVTSSEDAIQNKTSTQNTERASTFVAIKPADNSFFLSDEALYGREPTSVHPTGTFCPTEPKPGYHLTFTCKPCGFRSTHSISKQGYHNGTVLITCPDCKNRHVISDHLKVGSSFSSLCS